MYKLKIFISSKVDEHDSNLFSDMRKKIKAELECLKLFKVYIYEKGYSTSKNVVDDYLDEISDSHICLFLINRVEGIPDGVQKEIDGARKLKIPQIYIINPAGSQEEIPLEKELKKPDKSRIKIIDEFDEFYSESIEAIKSEIVKIYKDYSSGRLLRKQEEEESLIDFKLSITETNLKKSYIKGFRETQKHIASYLHTETKISKKINSNRLDIHTEKFFDVLIGKENINNINITFYLDELKKWHREEVYEVIEFRWKAIQYYFSGDLEKCIENLKIAYKKAENNKLAPWLIQDILIDLRNKVAMYYRNQNQFEKNPQYQEFLTNEEVFLTYPVIDRLDKQLLERIEKKRKSEVFKKAHTITYDNVLSEYASTLTSIFIVAAHYGSLTHLEMMINRLQDVYFHLVEIYSNWEFKLMLLKINILLTDKKGLEKALRKYNKDYSQIHSKDVEDILSVASKQMNEITREKNVLMTLSYLGYYLEVDSYNNYADIVYIEFNQWLRDSKRSVFLGDHYFKFFKENIERLNQNKIVEFANYVYTNPIPRFNNQVLEMLKEINFIEVDEERTKELLININNQFKNKELDRFDYLRILLIRIYKTKMFKSELDSIAEKYLPTEERKLYISAAKEADYSPYETYIESIESLEYITRETTRGISYTSFGYNNFSILKFTLKRIEQLAKEDIQRLLKLLVKLIIDENEESDAKVNALQLIIYLKNNDDRFSTMKSYYKEIIKAEQNVLNSRESFTFNHSSLVINFNYELLKLIFKESSLQLEYQFISDLTNGSLAERLSFSKAIRNYLEGNKSIIDPLIIQLLFILKSDEDEQVRANSIFGMINLISNLESEKLLIEISKLMNTETTLIKSIILSNIEVIKEKDLKIAQYILQKGRIDSNYLIRKQTQRINQSTD